MIRSLIFVTFFVLCLSDLFGQKWTIMNTSNSDIMTDNIRKIAVDEANDKVWFYSNDSLLIYTDGENWGSYRTDDLEVNIYKKPAGMAVDADGVLWIAWTGRGLVKFSDGTAEVISVGNNYFNSISVAPDGAVWIGSNVLYRYKNEQLTTYTKDNSCLPEGTMSIQAPAVFGSQGNTWVAGDCGGLARLNTNGEWAQYRETDFSGLDASYSCLRNTYSLAMDNNGRLIAGTQCAELFILDVDNMSAVDYFNKDNSEMTQDIIWRIAIDKLNNIWVDRFYDNAADGLACYNGSEWKYYNTENSPLPSNKVYDLTTGPEGNIIVATNKGVALIEPDATDVPTETTREKIIVRVSSVGDYLNIIMPEVYYGYEYSFRLYDIMGRIVINRNIPANNMIYTGELNSGVYIYSILTGNKVETSGKIIIPAR